VDAQVWDYLLRASGMWTFLDTEARSTWTRDLASGDVPELTLANVTATFQQLHAQREELRDRGVLGVFRSLSWDYRSNLPHRFGKRVVMTRAVHTYPSGGGGGVTFEAGNKMDDLVRVMLLLDGKPEPDHRQGAYRVLDAAHWPFTTNDVELHGMLRVRGFRNGNAHVYFLREDLVDQLNTILAKHHPNALPPQRS
jgi:hypothetical protein